MNKKTIKSITLAAAILSIIMIFYTPISLGTNFFPKLEILKQLWYPISWALFVLNIIVLVYTGKLLVEQPKLKKPRLLLLIVWIVEFSIAILYTIAIAIFYAGKVRDDAFILVIVYGIVLVSLEICESIALWILWTKIKTENINLQENSMQDNTPKTFEESNVN